MRELTARSTTVSLGMPGRPALGFLTITVTFFVGLFPGSELGLECAAIFAIFTAQAWNMTFSFYHSLVAQPTELDEAVRIFRLTKWERFWRLDVPSSMIGLVWNSMMSFGGGWFFLAASEIIIVSGRSKALPGIGSYMQTAEAAKDVPAIWAAIGTMIVMIIVVNALFWRPIVAWAEKFRMESSAAEQAPRSVTLDLLRRSHAPAVAGALFRPLGRLLDRVTRPFGLAERPLESNQRRRRAGDIAFAVVFCALPRTRPAPRSTPPSAGAATASCTPTTPATASSLCGPADRHRRHPRAENRWSPPGNRPDDRREATIVEGALGPRTPVNPC